MFDSFIQFVRQEFQSEDFIALHGPVFAGNEKKYLNECLDSTYVSSVGKFVDEFEKRVAEFVGSKYAVAAVNGTQALFLALKLAGARPETEVISQALTFIATANAISYTGAKPVFIDVDPDTLGLSPAALKKFLAGNVCLKNGKSFNRRTGREIIACLPMHTMGHPCRIDEIKAICQDYGLTLIEDAAESLGSFYQNQHTGTFGSMGVFSFNGNKIVTTGGGGMLVTDDQELARRAKHLTTTAKIPHRWEFIHDQIGYNFRLPNINAALGVAQMEVLPQFLRSKRQLARQYHDFFNKRGVTFLLEPPHAAANYWLNTIILKDQQERDAFLEYTNDRQVMTRALWRPLPLLAMYQDCQTDALEITRYMYERAVNIPSSVRKWIG